MKNISLIITGILLVSAVSFAGTEESLSQEQILNVFSSLKTQTRLSWIPSGAIEATHIHIDTETNEVVTTTEKIKYDGNKFRWVIDVESHEDIGGKPKLSADVRLNAKRVFLWDGNEYSLYFKSGENSIVYDDTANIPVNVNGPLKAGVVPWGHGIFKVDEMAKNLISAIRDADGKIVMQLKKDSEYTMQLKLDPTKNYAVLSHILEWTGKSRNTNTYSDFVKYGDYWIPSTIVIDRADYISETNPTQSGDLWQITSVNVSPPTEDLFKAAYDDNTRVKYRTMDRVMSYRHKTGRNAEYMLQHRKYNASLTDRDDRNCATAALLYVLSMFDKEINTTDFDGLVTGTDKSTTLFQIDEFIKSKELNSIAVKSDLEKLSALKDCQIILHLPKAKHYVILDHIDGKYAWIIDLDSDKFYYRMPIDQFKELWTDQTAMVISNKPITAPAGSTDLPEDKLHQMKGATGGFGTYSCSKLIQEEDDKPCSQFMGFCGGTYVIWYDVYECQLDAAGGYCSGENVLSRASNACIDDIGGGCTVAGAWKSYYMHGCN